MWLVDTPQPTCGLATVACQLSLSAWDSSPRSPAVINLRPNFFRPTMLCDRLTPTCGPGATVPSLNTNLRPVCYHIQYYTSLWPSWVPDRLHLGADIAKSSVWNLTEICGDKPYSSFRPKLCAISQRHKPILMLCVWSLVGNLSLISHPQVILGWFVSKLTSHSRVDSNHSQITSLCSHPSSVTWQEQFPNGLKFKSDLRQIHDPLGGTYDIQVSNIEGN